MADFYKAQEFVKVAEGGYGNNPNDSGNWTGGRIGVGNLVGTNHGISAPVLSKYLGRTATEEDMRNLPYSTALKIYKNQFWDSLNLDQVKNQSVALLIYDSGVNIGTGWVKGAAVDSLNAVGHNVSKSDSWKTIVDKVNQSPQQKFYETFWNTRKAKYDSMSGSIFYKGWMNRLNRLSFFLSKKIREKPAIPIIAVLLTAAVITGIIVYRKRITKTLNK